jgi:hypothetical protein
MRQSNVTDTANLQYSVVRGDLQYILLRINGRESAESSPDKWAKLRVTGRSDHSK